MNISRMMQGVLAGGAMIVAAAGVAKAQDDAKAAFEARYTELRTAMVARDAAKVGAVLAPDYQSTDIRGDVHSRSEVLERLGQMPGGSDAKPQTRVIAVSLNGESAAVDSEMTVQMKRPDDKGEEMTLDITVKADDTWVQRGGAWLLQKTVQKEMSVARNGEVVFRQAN